MEYSGRVPKKGKERIHEVYWILKEKGFLPYITEIILFNYSNILF